MHRHARRNGGRRQRTQASEQVNVQLLGRFEVTVDGTTTPSRGWTRRTASALVKVLALAPGHRLHREQVMDLLWPDDAPDAAAPKLHKAAHFVRKATGCDDAVVLRNDVVRLFPAADLKVDVDLFDALSRRAIADGDPALAHDALEHYAGELLPDDLYEEWAGDRRELLRLRHLALLRLTGQWMAVAEHDPGDEEANVELMRDHVAHGDCRAALLQYERLDRAVGVPDGSVARELRDRVAAGIASAATPRLERPRLVTGTGPTASSHHSTRVEELLAELTDLTRRLATVLDTLAAAGSVGPSLTAIGAA